MQIDRYTVAGPDIGGVSCLSVCGERKKEREREKRVNYADR